MIKEHLTRQFNKISLLLCLLVYCPFFALAQNHTVPTGSYTSSVSFPSTGCTYNWTNDHPEIGLPATGTGNIPSFIAVNSGNTPITATIRVKPTPPSTAYILGYSDVTVINTANNQRIKTITIGQFMLGIAVNPKGNAVYAARQNTSALEVINTSTNTVDKEIPLPADPYLVAVSPDGKLVYVGLFNSAKPIVAIIDAETNTLVGTLEGNTTGNAYIYGLTVSPDGQSIYAQTGGNKILVFDATSHAQLRVLTTTGRSDYMVMSKDGYRIFLLDHFNNTVKVISANNGDVVQTFTASQPYSATLSPDGKYLYITQTNVPSLMVLNTTDYSVNAISLDRADYIGISITPDGKSLYLVNSSSNNVRVLDLASKNIVATPTASTGASYGNFILPGITCSPEFTFTITVNPLSAAVIAPSGTPNSVSTIYGTYSASSTFNVSAAGLTSSILVSPPAGFEVSTDNINFGNTASIFNNGTVDSQPIYIRLAATTAVGTYSGNVTLSSPGAQNQVVFMPASTVTKKQLTITANDKTRAVNTPNPVFTASYNGFVNGDGPADLDMPSLFSTPATTNSPAGLYPILLSSGFDNNYTINTVNGTLTIEPNGIPNSFTPNGDGVNDYWKLSSKTVPAGCVVSVYNRTGQRIYYSVGYAVPWNGTFKGQLLPVGTYYFVIDTKDGRQPQSGSVTIIR